MGQVDKPSHNYLKIDFKGPKNNVSGIGAKLVIRMEDGTFQYQEHYLNRGYMSSVQDIVHFGLGNAKTIKSLQILWPDGKFQQLTAIESNQTITLNHNKAVTIRQGALAFPLVQKKTTPIFSVK